MTTETAAKPDKFDVLITDLTKLGVELAPKAKKAWKVKDRLAALRVSTQAAYRGAQEICDNFDRDRIAWDAAQLLEAGGDPNKEGAQWWDRERPNLEGYEADAKSAALAYDLSCRELAQAIYTDRKLVEKLDEAWQRIVHKGNVTDTTTLAELRQLEAEAELGTPTLRTFGVSFAMWQGATPNEVKRLRKLFRNPEGQANFPTLARLRAAIRAVDVQNSQPSPEERLATQRDRASAIAAAAIGAQGRTLAPEDRIEIGDTINKANKANKAAETEAELASVTK